MVIAKLANLALTFLLELCMLAALGFWGFSAGNGLAAQISLCVGAPLLAAIVWGLFLAPASSRRLREPFHQVLELVIFSLAFVALFAAGQPTLTAIFVIVYAINFVLRFVWRQSKS